MGQNRYRDELERALARSDAKSLRDTISVYHQFAALDGKAAQSFYDDNSVEIDAVILSVNDPDKAFAYLALSTSMFDEPRFLMLMAAGPLENLMKKPRREVIGRIVAEARKNPRFRWMLTGVYLHAISDDARLAIAPLIAGMSSEGPVPDRSS
ncbi:hypothetical protein KD146_12220 [Devosia sp. BSSL-BM10]|jgi:hypothetical protein|uniref:DUF6869 domain-containing protein n=1 Tax=Devosia litorisediminis TaxID=2829817 RepID=A0A942EBR0_9HYPH|nr:hypothetical protein [Devosia litorisediminis]MBS3849464.1 hypothetical protein [Devosia litorisediminis]